MSHSIDVDIQWALDDIADANEQPITDQLILQTVEQVLTSHNDGQGELTVRFVDTEESQSLNLAYRAKDKPTNVLSFPSELPDFIESPLLGDLVICHAVVCQEASAQNKAIHAHYQHLIVHGVLHLLGFDHIEEQDANVMEAHEIALLDKLGIDDPYQVD
ncbi:MAG: rRNA maturation RNase YbeY [Glaciecola sp.]|jgi:probable rRNA maturation factor|nr:rRNA maturation RNase YbeY [Glaciecola sp.]MDG1814630.1 rRNA maturation RNase YbeY [Glaciecola sp.]MDG2100327.1 rRNA maturation RNase YbeY [Glaciecola sp.]